MNDPTTRIGGDHGARAGNLIPSFVIDTADAPAPSGAARAPEWIELLPAGQFFGRDGRGPFRLDDPAAVIAASADLGLSAGLPVDYDHATDFAAPEGRPAPAAGWIRELSVRGGALWGRVEWTERAAQSIAAREYRYVSPVFQFDPQNGAVTRLLRAGLTNNPNLHLTAIAAAGLIAADAVGNSSRGAIERGAKEIDQPIAQAAKERSMDYFTKELLEILGLSPDAAPADVIARVRELCAVRDAAVATSAQSSADHFDPARFVAVAEFERVLTELNAMRAERVRERAAHQVEEAIRAGKVVPAQREWAIAYCAADTRGFLAFVAKQPIVVGGESKLGLEPPAAGRGSSLSATEHAICAQLGLKHSDFVRRKGGRADFLSLGTGDEANRNPDTARNSD